MFFSPFAQALLSTGCVPCLQLRVSMFLPALWLVVPLRFLWGLIRDRAGSPIWAPGDHPELSLSEADQSVHGPCVNRLVS